LIPSCNRASVAARFREFVAAPVDPPCLELAAQLGEQTARRRLGCDFPVEVILSPLRMADRMLAIYIVRDISERKAAEAAMRRAQEELERRVAERTADLAKANEYLQIEIAERKRAEEERLRHVEQLEAAAAQIREQSLAL